MQRAQAFIEEQRNLGKEMTSMLDRAIQEGRELTDDEATEHDRMGERYDALTGMIDRIEADQRRIEAADRVEIRGRGAADDNLEVEQASAQAGANDAEARQAAHERAFSNYLRHGLFGLSAEDRSIMRSTHRVEAGEERAQTTQTGSTGGFTVPQGFLNELQKTMLAFGGARAVGSRILTTDSGNPMMIPTMNDTANAGHLIAENTADTVVDITFGQKQLDAFKYGSNIVLVPFELFEDGAFSVDQYTAEALGERLGRITNTHHTVGSGSGQPQGFNTAAATGKTAAAAAAVTYAELIDLQHSIDPAYRALDTAWTFNDATFAILRKLVDGDGRPLWNPAGAGLAGTVPNTFLGDRYVINQDMPAMTTGLKPISYGAFGKGFIIRDVRSGVRLRRLDERYAEADQVAFLAFIRTDSEMVDAAAVKNLLMA